MLSQFWSTDFFSEIYDNVIDSLRMRTYGPHWNSSNMQFLSSSNSSDGPNCEFEVNWSHVIINFSNLKFWSIRTIRTGPKLLIRRVLMWTKSASSLRINHVIINFGEKVSGPKLRRQAYGVTWLLPLWTKNHTLVYDYLLVTCLTLMVLRGGPKF